MAGAPSDKRVHLLRQTNTQGASGTSRGGTAPPNNHADFLHWRSDQQFLELPSLPKPVIIGRRSDSQVQSYIPGEVPSLCQSRGGRGWEPGAKARGCQGREALGSRGPRALVASPGKSHHPRERGPVAPTKAEQEGTSGKRRPKGYGGRSDGRSDF